jgi:hypothetical protein
MTTKKIIMDETRKIIRTTDAGVFFAEIVALRGDVADLKRSRRIWYWSGAASLSGLAVQGTTNPSSCKFPAEVANHTIFGVIEILDVTPTAAAAIDGVPQWIV